MLILAAIFAGFLVFLLMVLIGEYLRRSNSDVSQRMQAYVAGEELSVKPKKEIQDYTQHGMQFVQTLAQRLPNLRFIKRLDIKLQRAGLPLLGSEYLIILLLLSFLLAGFTALLTLQVLPSVLIFLCAAAGVWGYMEFRIDHRRKAFNNQLGDALSLVSNAMRSGFSFMQAMDLISREMQPPIGKEFAQVMREIHIGVPLETALQNMVERVDSSDFELVATAVLIQRQVGGNLAQILDTISMTINDRIRMKREVLALTAQGRMSGWVLAALPLGVAAVLSVVSPNYLRPLIDEGIGHIAIGAGIVLEIIGFIIIQKIVDIDV